MDVKIELNKSDIGVFDKVKKEITIIEVGITSQECLQTVELEKRRKYDLLANEREGSNYLFAQSLLSDLLQITL